MDIPIINNKMDKYEISTSDIFNISLTINIKIMVYIIGKSSNMGTGYEKSPHFAGIEKIL